MNANNFNPNRRPVRRCLAAAAILVLLGAQNRPKEERHPEFTKAMQVIATQLEDLLKDGDARSVVVGPFTGPGDQKHPAIVQALSKMLKDKSAVTRTDVVDKFDGDAWRVHGTVAHGKDPASGLFVGMIDCRLTNSAGNLVNVLSRKIINAEEDVLALAPATVDLQAVAGAPSNGVGKAELRGDAIRAALEKANFTLDKQTSIVRASGSSPYGMEIVVVDTSGLVSSPVRSENGQACVDLKPGQAYAVRVWNDSPYDAGVQLTIDGVNSLAFSQEAGYRQAGRWVVPAGKQGLIRGWHDVGNQLKQFLVGDFGGAPAARLGQPDKAGFISATFCASYFGNPPPDERSFGGVPRGMYATVIGPPVRQNIEPVACSFGVVRAAVAVRYVTHDLGDLPQK